MNEMMMKMKHLLLHVNCKRQIMEILFGRSNVSSSYPLHKKIKYFSLYSPYSVVPYMNECPCQKLTALPVKAALCSGVSPIPFLALTSAPF